MADSGPGTEIPPCIDPRFDREMLVRYDELHGGEGLALEAHLERCEGCRKRLVLLRAAEEMIPRAFELTAEHHPSAEDLYDFAGGLGAHSLTWARRSAVEIHALDCADCMKDVEKVRRDQCQDLVQSGALPSRVLPELGPGSLRRIGTARHAAFAAAAGILLALVLWQVGPPPRQEPEEETWRTGPEEFALIWPPVDFPVVVPAVAWFGPEEEVDVAVWTKGSGAGRGERLWSAPTRGHFTVIPPEAVLERDTSYIVEVVWRESTSDRRHDPRDIRVHAEVESIRAALRLLEGKDRQTATFLRDVGCLPDALLAFLRAGELKEAELLAGRMGVPWNPASRELLTRLAAEAVPR
ncbi:MAG: hypothetical protein L0323_20395 [Planctomycetes bacterium]|nr:hypothetical protein [Planctomycetota bacterium]